MTTSGCNALTRRMHAGGDAHVPPRASPDGPPAVAAQVSSSFSLLLYCCLTVMCLAHHLLLFVGVRIDHLVCLQVYVLSGWTLDRPLRWLAIRKDPTTWCAHTAPSSWLPVALSLCFLLCCSDSCCSYQLLSGCCCCLISVLDAPV